MATKERYQNPVVGDTVNLSLFAYNSNNRTNFSSVDKVEIYVLDQTLITDTNQDGRLLIETIDSASIANGETGLYTISVALNDADYSIGNYMDVWYITPRPDEEQATVENTFQIYPDLWYTTPIPVVYGFDFVFRPNKLRQGSKRYLIIEIKPNVPTTSDLARYYEALAIVSPLKINIEQECGDCLPQEQDLRIVVEDEPVTLREKTVAYYLLDTTDLDTGVYNVWFELDFGDTTHISDKLPLQIF